MTNKNDYYTIVERKVLRQIISKEYKKFYSGKEQGKVDKNHFLEVVRIVLQLWESFEKVELPIALKIAALCHDLDRIYPKYEVNTKDYPEKNYCYIKGIHSGTAVVLFILNNLELPKKLLFDVSYLILRHEGGGDKDSKSLLFEKKDHFTNSYNLNKAADYLWYADKLSFFYSNIYEYKKRGIDKLKNKIEFSINGLPRRIIEMVKKIDFNDDEIKTAIEEALLESSRE
jgi:hypothetical protein